MIKLDKKQYTIAIALGAVIFIFVIYQLIFVGFQKKINQLDKEIKLKESELRKSLTIQADKDRINNEYKNLAVYLKAEPSYKDAVGKFLRELESITQDSGVSVLNLNPKNPVDTDKDKKNNFLFADLRMEGTLEQLFKFLNKIQNSNLLIKLDKIVVAPKDEQASLLKIETDVSMLMP